MFTRKSENDVWRELCQDELEHVCGGHEAPRDYDSIDEQWEQNPPDRDLPGGPTLYRVFAL